MNDVAPTKQFAEFFAGVGLVRQALEEAGWNCNFANDLDEKKLDIYQKNFSHEHYILDDVWNVQESQVPSSAELYTASFPCVDLSVAGGRKGIRAERSGSFWALIDLLAKKREAAAAPRFVLLENVYGFLTTNGGSDLKEALTALNQLGYLVDVFIVDAKHFTPQSRVRVFVLGVDKSFKHPKIIERTRNNPFSNWSRAIENADPNLRTKRLIDFIYSDQEIDWFTVETPRLPTRNTVLANVMEDYPDDHKIWWSGEQRNRIVQQIPLHQLQYLESNKHGTDYLYGTIYRRMRKGKSTAELRVDGIAGCLRTPRGGSSKQIVARAGKGLISFRFMSPREYARLQGVSDTFELSPKDTASFFAMGDAVCVPAVKWIAENYLNELSAVE